MQLLLGEHGETLIYGVIGFVIVIIICSICFEKWKSISPAYKTSTENNNGNYIRNNQGKYPVIESDEVIYADYKNEKFDFRDFICAKDFDGTDLTDRLKIYGSVDVFQKGVYKLRCVVVSNSRLFCTKYVNVIVE